MALEILWSEAISRKIHTGPLTADGEEVSDHDSTTAESDSQTENRIAGSPRIVHLHDGDCSQHFRSEVHAQPVPFDSPLR